MPIVDLVSPWSQARETRDGLEAFHHRHRELLERVRRQRAPTGPHLEDPTPDARHIALAGNPSTHATLRRVRDAMQGAGWRTPTELVLLTGVEAGPAHELLPDPGRETLLLFVDRAEGDALTAALIAGIATWHRWSATAPGNPLAQFAAHGGWDKWEAMRHAPLAEWIYTEGIAVHAVAEWFPDWKIERLLPCARAAHERLRRLERQLRVELESELDQAGIGLVIKWLGGHISATLRRLNSGQAVPEGAGRYLAWRLLEERVARVGVRDAAGMEA